MLLNWLNNLFSKGNSGKAARSAGHTRNSSRPSSARKRTRQRAQAVTQNHPYRAVSVYSQAEQCEAAKRLRGTKFLAAHAPTLPLGGCTQNDQCRCKYRHYKDRRSELRRDSDHGMPPRVWLDQERRHRKDRRKSNKNGMAA
ncbi:MAG: hypothetical protein AAF541_17060 [Pseudomonadota bacterium]